MESINNKNYNEIIIFKKEYKEYDSFILDNGKKRKIQKYQIDNNIKINNDKNLNLLIKK